jgi:hypothetical protein
MSDIAERVRALIARAVHPNTPTEEARTSALIACQTIEKRELAVVPRLEIAVASHHVTLEPDPDPEPRRRISARYSGYCKCCHRHWWKDEEIWWARGRGATCYSCRREP